MAACRCFKLRDEVLIATSDSCRSFQLSEAFSHQWQPALDLAPWHFATPNHAKNHPCGIAKPPRSLLPSKIGGLHQIPSLPISCWIAAILLARPCFDRCSSCRSRLSIAVLSPFKQVIAPSKCDKGFYLGQNDPKFLKEAVSWAKLCLFLTRTVLSRNGFQVDVISYNCLLSAAWDEALEVMELMAAQFQERPAG